MIPTDPTLTREGRIRVELQQDKWIDERLKPELDRIAKEYAID